MQKKRKGSNSVDLKGSKDLLEKSMKIIEKLYDSYSGSGGATK